MIAFILSNGNGKLKM